MALNCLSSDQNARSAQLESVDSYIELVFPLPAVNVMSGLQVGDIIRLAELSWTIYNYGWGNDFQASESYPLPRPLGGPRL